MRILLISSSSGSRGGGEIFLRYLCQGLSAQDGISVGVWMSSAEVMDELAASIEAQGGEVLRGAYTNTYQRRLRSLSGIPKVDAERILNQWREWSPDLLHINKQNLEDGLDLLQVAEKSGIPTAATIHITQTQASLGAVGGGLRDLVARRVIRRCADVQLAAVSDLRSAGLEEFSGRGVRTIYNGVTLSATSQQLETWRRETRSELGWGDDHLCFIGVGRMVAQKRPLEFVRLAEQIHDRHPHARFAWVGDGDLAEDWDKATGDLEGDWIQRLPWQDSVQPWFAAADLFLHTAEFEGLPFAVVEALSHGLPAILPSSVTDEAKPLGGDGAMLSEEPSGWIERLGDQEFLREQSERSRSLHVAHFSLTAMIEEHVRLYSETQSRDV